MRKRHMGENVYEILKTLEWFDIRIKYQITYKSSQATSGTSLWAPVRRLGCKIIRSCQRLEGAIIQPLTCLCTAWLEQACTQFEISASPWWTWGWQPRGTLQLLQPSIDAQSYTPPRARCSRPPLQLSCRLQNTLSSTAQRVDRGTPCAGHPRTAQRSPWCTHVHSKHSSFISVEQSSEYSVAYSCIISSWQTSRSTLLQCSENSTKHLRLGTLRFQMIAVLLLFYNRRNCCRWSPIFFLL